jgi:hypothetical protein
MLRKGEEIFRLIKLTKVVHGHLRYKDVPKILLGVGAALPSAEIIAGGRFQFNPMSQK